MDHKLIDLDSLKNLTIYKKENNLDGLDNLSTLPNSSAIYGICGVVNGAPANCRFVGYTKDLQKSIKTHFSDKESDDCLKSFMQSIKIKSLVYQIVSEEDDNKVEELMSNLKKKLDPQCNEKLNEVF